MGFEVRASQLAQASERVGSLRPEEDQSIWSKRRQGFQPCCEAGIREPTLSDMGFVRHTKLRRRKDDNLQVVIFCIWGCESGEVSVRVLREKNHRGCLHHWLQEVD